MATLLVTAMAATSAGQFPPPTSSPARPAGEPQSAPSRNAGKPFQPGVAIDWTRRRVIVDSRIVFREGPLEFFACFAGKEHESILRLEASGAHIFQALGLVGMEPGTPPVWDADAGQFSRPTGALVELEMEWVQDGEQRAARAFDWLRQVEYARRPVPRPWVFAGSYVRPGGTLACDETGAGIAVVDFPDSLICLSGPHSSSNAELWLETETAAIPPLQTPVKLLISPAAARRPQISLDFRGSARWNGEFVQPAELAELILLELQVGDHALLPITLDRTPQADAAHLLDVLLARGVPSGSVRLLRKPNAEEAGRMPAPPDGRADTAESPPD